MSIQKLSLDESVQHVHEIHQFNTGIEWSNLCPYISSNLVARDV